MNGLLNEAKLFSQTLDLHAMCGLGRCTHLGGFSLTSASHQSEMTWKAQIVILNSCLNEFFDRRLIIAKTACFFRPEHVSEINSQSHAISGVCLPEWGASETKAYDYHPIVHCSLPKLRINPTEQQRSVISGLVA